MFEVGRICIKLAGRDAGRECVIVDVLDDRYVLIDGNVRRRKCNVLHLEPTKMTIEIKKNASHDDVASKFKENNMGVWQTKARTVAEKPVKIRGTVKAAAQEDKPKKEKRADKKTVKEAVVVQEKKEAKAEKPKAKKVAKPEEKKEESDKKTTKKASKKE